MHPHITDKTILVTGAAGSIGSALCQHLLALRPACLIAVNLTEAALVALERRLSGLPDAAGVEIRYVLGDVRDAALLARWLPGVDTLIHAAAYKFVPVCEGNPSAAVVNNVGGMLTLMRAAQEAQVARCLLVSSDKAVNPSSVMGACKRLCERLVSTVGAPWRTVRFGNVLDSSGSVLPLWREQIAAGGPVTVTDKDCTRYFMSVDEACTLILEALTLDAGTYVLDMGEPRNLYQMAQELVAACDTSCDIELIGLRPGDKLTEELYDGERHPTAHPRVFQVDEAPPLPLHHPVLQRLLEAARRYDDASTTQTLWPLATATSDALMIGPWPDEALTFVTWKWRGTDPARTFPAEAANVLYAMLQRHYHAAFRLVCFTDDAAGLDSSIVALPLPETKADGLPAPSQGQSKRFPSCYRRLWLFSADATALGKRICQLDMDVIILDNITKLIQRKTADFVGWCDSKTSWNKIAGGFWLLNTGTHTEVWDEFKPDVSPLMAHNKGFHGSDQAWLSYKLFPPEDAVTDKDGLVKLGNLGKGGQHPPSTVKIVFTSGVTAPWLEQTRLGHRWITQHWRVGE